MSNTTVFFLAGKDCFEADFKNAFRGAMYVWNDTARRYCDFERFPSFNEEDQMKVWNFGNNHPDKMPMHEAIVMASTMDRALLEPSKWLDLVNSFEAYAELHPNSSIGEQAKAIREVMESDKAASITGIGWRQTSVCGDSLWSRFDDDSDEYVTYDPSSEDSHFWIMEQVAGVYEITK
jgi:hypothetical protein